MEKFDVIQDCAQRVRRYNLLARRLHFKIRSVPRNKDPSDWAKAAIKDAILHATADLEPTDRVAFSFFSPSFHKGEGWMAFKQASQVTVESVFAVLSGIFQSNSEALDTDTFVLGVTTVRLPTGSGRGSKYNTFNEECGMRKGIVQINNKDNLCLPRALVVAIAHADKDPDYRKVRRDISKLQTERAKKLTEEADVKISEEGAGIPEIEKFQRYLKEYNIVVYKYGTKGRDTIFRQTGGNKNLNLIYHEGHYNIITSLTAAFTCIYFCELCNVPYNNKDDHKCGRTCFACQHAPPCIREKDIHCQNCNRNFKNQTCFDNHKRAQGKKESMCGQIQRCRDCLKTVKKNRQHTCDEIYCKVCQKHMPGNHLCYMRVDTANPKIHDLLFVFYDLETKQEKQIQGGALLHEPNLCVFSQRCSNCLDERNMRMCKNCGMRLQKIHGADVIASFTSHILQIRKKFKNVVVIAHNGQAFDHQFILNFIITQTDLTPEVIKRGTKLLLLTLGNVRFLDSINYFPMALSALPKIFGLTELKKGYFPHLFNTTENQNYVGPLPAIEYYSAGTMKPDAREIFMKWYEKHRDNIFDFQKEIVDYCVSDVQILTEACLVFREQLLKVGNVCPFTEAATLPSACNKIFRRNFLEPGTIGIIPKNGYRWRDNQSKIAIMWLINEEQQRGMEIIYAAKNKEVVVAGVKVDGYCVETKEIYEFHGCYYHGCPRCVKYNRESPTHDDPTDTMESRYMLTVAKTDRLRSKGYKVIEKWECDFRRELSPDLEKTLQNHPLLVSLPLNPRDAFYGGRTGAVKLYYKIKPGEKIKYVDVCSLYPWVCKYGKYPVGHPIVLVGEECNKFNLEETDGLIKCKILPPTSLYHPVLPIKMNAKLMFTLCRMCCEQQTTDDCNHCDDERALLGTWVMDEVIKAVQMGYRILDIHEIWQYKTQHYDKKMGGLFTQMINQFMKIKQQASGWPSNCVTPEDKSAYIQAFLQSEGVQLEFEEVVKNPGLRSLAKLILNSFWGKFGQRENQPRTNIINRPDEFFSMLQDSAIDVNTVTPINENTVIVNWEFKEESYDPLSTVNVALAAYTTAQARLKLYSYLEQLGERVLYYDTDSVIYISKEGKPDISTGSSLGEMTDELEEYGRGTYITEFASGGPKLYAYQTYTPSTGHIHEVCKAKGIRITYDSSKIVNFEKLKNMVLKPEPPVYIVGTNIRRNTEHEVFTVNEKKILQLSFKKRQRVEEYDSVPYGFKRCKN